MIRWLVLCFLRLALAFAAPVAWGVALPGHGLRAVAGTFGGPDSVAVDLQISATLGAGTDSLSRTALAGPGSEAPVYDADGNFQSDARWTCTWDALDRLIGIETAAGVPAAVPHLRLAFTYDSVGRRIRKEVWQLSGTGPATTIPPPAAPVWVKRLDRRFHYHGWDLIAETDPDGSPVRTYLWGLDLSGTLGGAGGNGGLLAVTTFPAATAAPGTAPATQWIACDGNANVTLQTDAATGSVSGEWAYDPFGNVLTRRGAGTGANPFRFSTRYTDEETGLLYYGYRYLDPESGRWLNRDPLGESGGVNLYGFAGNDPTGRTDVLGNVTYQEVNSTMWAAQQTLGYLELAEKTVRGRLDLYQEARGEWEKKLYCESIAELQRLRAQLPGQIEGMQSLLKAYLAEEADRGYWSNFFDPSMAQHALGHYGKLLADLREAEQAGLEMGDLVTQSVVASAAIINAGTDVLNTLGDYALAEGVTRVVSQTVVQGSLLAINPAAGLTGLAADRAGYYTARALGASESTANAIGMVAGLASGAFNVGGAGARLGAPRSGFFQKSLSGAGAIVPEKHLNVTLRFLEKQGVGIMRGKEAERLLKSIGAKAAYWPAEGKAGTLILPRNVTRGQLAEEVLHYVQYRKAGFPTSGTPEGVLQGLRFELDAQRRLINLGRARGWSESDVESYRRALKIWQKQLIESQANQ